ncbi:RAMP superfamily CRISPR-associated protein [Rhodoferax antarcticus]|uniref:RAMP superfamily CRISPR-associated protein n=1 Tax=Rhodoferax antarcticus TaxID=81479 RepID=UPI002224D59E|nr:RAMP superfamily CRISPR-associated protein [Rhodoferax antarcticus]MCW2313124.1 CRISPR-associated protein Csm5 [Rhodoferax antarcticus]
MNAFLKTYRLALTPLSPIHIGCGEDFEPTNYVIDDGVLYGFDPSRAVLTDLQRSKLTDAANRVSLLAIQRFFKDNAKDFMAHADVLVPVSHGVGKKYESDIGRAVNVEASGNAVFNKFAIERHSYTGPQRLPYIPGSSFKGALRTAWLDELNGERQPTDVQFSFKGEAKSTTVMEKRLFKGDFATSPLRLLKVADLMPSPSCELARRVLYAVNLKKKQVIKDGQELTPKGISARKECILHGQYRALVADAVLPQLQAHHSGKDTPAPELRPTDLRQVASQSNAYNLQRLQRELAVLDGRGMVNPDWKQGMNKLLAGELGKRLNSGDAFLIRLGRYGGAESKTLTGEGVANIKIMGAKGQPPTFEPTTKTVWLAAENEHDQKGLLPFGWAVVEIDPQHDLPQLKAWCDLQAQGRRDMVALRHQFDDQKKAALHQKAEQAALAARRIEQEKADEIAKQQRALQLASLSEQGRQVEDLRQRCEDWAAKLPPNGNFKRQDANIAKVGLFQDAYKLVTQALSNPDWQAADKAALADMLEQCLPTVVAPWGKDERKKLKLNALCDQTA